MSVPLLNAIYRWQSQWDLTPGERNCLVNIAWRVDDNGLSSHLSKGDVFRETGLRRTCAYQSITALCQKGFLSSEKEPLSLNVDKVMEFVKRTDDSVKQTSDSVKRTEMSEKRHPIRQDNKTSKTRERSLIWTDNEEAFLKAYGKEPKNASQFKEELQAVLDEVPLDRLLVSVKNYIRGLTESDEMRFRRLPEKWLTEGDWHRTLPPRPDPRDRELTPEEKKAEALRNVRAQAKLLGLNYDDFV